MASGGSSPTSRTRVLTSGLTSNAWEGVSGDRVLAFLRLTVHGRASGLPIHAETGNVYEFEEGKIRRIQIFLDREEALEAAGLSE